MSLLLLDAVSKSYWRGARDIAVLDRVSLEVRAGDLVAIYGPRGSGKTTLLRIAAGFEQPDTGRVWFDGRDLSLCSRRELARLHRDRIGWVERQGPHSAELTAGDYVALSLYRELGPREARRRAVLALARVGAEDCADDRWDHLTDASRALVATAEALAREPAILVVDDTAAGLGIVDRERIMGILRSAAEDERIGVVVAAPDMPAMVQAHRVHSLSRGRLLTPEGGPPDDDARILEFPRDRRSA